GQDPHRLVIAAQRDPAGEPVEAGIGQPQRVAVFAQPVEGGRSQVLRGEGVQGRGVRRILHAPVDRQVPACGQLVDHLDQAGSVAFRTRNPAFQSVTSSSASASPALSPSACSSCQEASCCAAESSSPGLTSSSHCQTSASSAASSSTFSPAWKLWAKLSSGS